MLPFNVPLSPTINACSVILPLTENHCVVMFLSTLLGVNLAVLDKLKYRLLWMFIIHIVHFQNSYCTSVQFWFTFQTTLFCYFIPLYLYMYTTVFIVWLPIYPLLSLVVTTTPIMQERNVKDHFFSHIPQFISQPSRFIIDTISTCCRFLVLNI